MFTIFFCTMVIAVRQEVNQFSIEEIDFFWRQVFHGTSLEAVMLMPQTDFTLMGKTKRDEIFQKDITLGEKAFTTAIATDLKNDNFVSVVRMWCQWGLVKEYMYDVLLIGNVNGRMAITIDTGGSRPALEGRGERLYPEMKVHFIVVKPGLTSLKHGVKTEVSDERAREIFHLLNTPPLKAQLEISKVKVLWLNKDENFESLRDFELDIKLWQSIVNYDSGIIRGKVEEKIGGFLTFLADDESGESNAGDYQSRFNEGFASVKELYLKHFGYDDYSEKVMSSFAKNKDIFIDSQTTQKISKRRVL